VSHRNARPTFHGRCLLVRRVLFDRRPQAHVAKEVGVSRQCAYYCPTRTAPAVHVQALAGRAELPCGPAGIAAATGAPARTVSRIWPAAGRPGWRTATR
jgi:hypothetical protein